MGDAVVRFILWVMGIIFRALPRSAALALGRALGSLAYLLATRRRKLAISNLEMALGEEYTPQQLKGIARKSFQNLGMNIAEFYDLPRLTSESVSEIMTFEGEEHLYKCLSMGKGVLVLSGHMGNWDLLSTVLTLKEYPMTLITKTSRNRAVNDLWMKYRVDHGVKIITGRGTIRKTLRLLKEGEMVVFVLDQNARLTEGVFVPFFGREACTMTSLALMARRTGVPVIPIHSYRTGSGHHAVLGKPLQHVQLSDQDQDILERTRNYTEWVEKTIRQNPDQWTWLHDRWKTRPKA